MNLRLKSTGIRWMEAVEQKLNGGARLHNIHTGTGLSQTLEDRGSSKAHRLLLGGQTLAPHSGRRRWCGVGGDSC